MTVCTRCIVAVLLVAALALLGAGAALAASPIGVSSNGKTWTGSLSKPIFDANVLWVPGDVRTGTFYVRNQATDAGSLSLRADALDPDGLVRRNDIRLDVRRDGGAWSALPADGQQHRLATAQLGASKSTRIEVRAVFDSASPNRSQKESVTVRFSVGLTESRAGVSGPDGSSSGGLLPNTGGVSFWVLLFGLGLAVSGGLTVFLVGRDRSEDV
jgi:hypothetical protein